MLLLSSLSLVWNNCIFDNMILNFHFSRRITVLVKKLSSDLGSAGSIDFRGGSDFSPPCSGNPCKMRLCVQCSLPHRNALHKAPVAEGAGSPGKATHPSEHTQLLIRTLPFPVFFSLLALPLVLLNAYIICFTVKCVCPQEQSLQSREHHNHAMTLLDHSILSAKVLVWSLLPQ